MVAGCKGENQMSEGKLQKEIESLASPDGGFVLIHDLKDVLNEAKKEWKLPDAVHPTSDLKSEAERLELDVLRRNVSENQKWFKRWFGDKQCQK